MLSCASVKEKHKAVPEGESGNLRFHRQLSPTVPAHAVPRSCRRRTFETAARERPAVAITWYRVDGNCGTCCSGYTLRAVVDVKPDLNKDVQ
jgi:hypothetical protein